MPASCTFRLKRLSATSNESPGRTIISVMKTARTILGRWSEKYAGTGNNYCNKPVCLLAAEKVLASRYRRSHRWHHTFDAHRDPDIHRCFCQRKTSIPAYGQPDILGSGWVHCSVLG